MNEAVELRRVASTRVSNINKHTVEGEMPVRLCNYTDVYYGETLGRGQNYMAATATSAQVAAFTLRDGDTVITKDSETAEDIGIAAYINDPPADLVCGYHLAILRPGHDVYPKYMTWAVRSSLARGSLSQLATGMTRMGLTYDALNRTPVPPRPLDEQRRIADFLDDQVARIDAVIVARSRGIDLVGEEFDSEWDARASALRGPEVQLRRVLASIVDGPFGSSLTSAHYSDEGTRVIRLGNIGIARFRGADEAYISDEYAASLRQHSVVPGDLIMAGLGDDRWSLGRSCVAPRDLGPAIVKADCYRIRLTDAMSSEFASWYLSAPAARRGFLELSRGATRARLNTAVVRDVEVRLPSAHDQEEFVRAMESDREVLTAREQTLTRSSRLLTEYKQSLITGAVSGDFDVSTASGRSEP